MKLNHMANAEGIALAVSTNNLERPNGVRIAAIIFYPTKWQESFAASARAICLSDYVWHPPKSSIRTRETIWSASLNWRWERLADSHNKVEYYTKGEAIVNVYFPEGDVSCHWCPFWRSEESLKRSRCIITNEILFKPLLALGEKCPIVIQE